MTTARDLTLEEKASLLSGKDFWTTKNIDRAGVPSIMMTDGPHGLRKQTGSSDNLGINDSIPATCFPPAVGLGSAFDPELAAKVGVALGVESAIEDVAVLLGPGVNIKRSPLCGRNFEYFSEDPHHAGEVATGMVRGMQSRGVGASLKHFAANNQETDRMRVSADVDPRPLREIYFRAFERVVKNAQPWTVMCSYNKVNGTYASEHPWLLTDVLRDEWGFDGLVVSDCGAVNDRVKGVAAGLDLEMPSSDGVTDAQIIAAVRGGDLDEALVDRAVQRVLDLVEKSGHREKPDGPLDVDAHHALAREAATRSVVLLRNEGSLLPLAEGQDIALIGEFARTPRYQGGGSSHITPTRVDTALDSFTQAVGDRVSFAPGFTFDGEPSASLRAEAVELARSNDVAVVFLGLPDAAESEGFDRTTIDLPADQIELLDEVVEANPRTVVVLSNGGVVSLPFADTVPAIVEGWLLGQAGGSAIVDILTGASDPSGRLSETIPHRLEDTPSYGNFPGELGHVRYGEGVHVGYRWYDKRGLEVAFPFGHGLTYTDFDYGEPTVQVNARGGLDVSVDVTNVGPRDGREVVQVYVGRDESAVDRSPRELKAFSSVEIASGQTRRVTLTVDRSDLAYWDIRVDRFVVEEGTYRVEVGASSRDIRGEVSVSIDGDDPDIELTREASLGEVLAHPKAGPVARQWLAGFMGDPDAEDAGQKTESQTGAVAGAEASPGGEQTDIGMMMASFPVGRLVSFGVPQEKVDELIRLGQS
ncbi:glycoside hydrolase family 3 C-terminal domain-containing protein [Kocuria massiliensis]|uniref:glycoside hydrolase family 3 C-terminal domain-containing protein n=1 Tax=Kocuria massiliensis TaxID=1926282 RepID=UPI0022B9A7B0|nr:glycoside hydrolase family 3 C-terminal domain-containing protein [Kocuria massiliensis]